MGTKNSKERRNYQLLQASGKGNIVEVQELLSNGAKANCRHVSGITPLMYAAANGHTEVCKVLLETGKANLKDRSPRDFSPFLFAAESGHTDVCKLLLANGSDLEESTLYSALRFATAYGHQSLLDLLLSQGADVNWRNRIGSTPLHSSSREGNLSIMETLLQAGADPLLPTMEGALPIHIAAQNNQPGAVRILIEKGRCSPDQVRLKANHLYLIFVNLGTTPNYLSL